ncbi:MAG TPA: GAF domain-containing protein [Burkholderiales bacterium]|nr:GAF domain-containing protein [Burkholderiales bacterium]
MEDTVYSRTLQRAAEVLGGKSKLREVLRVPLRELDRWMVGAERPPTDIFLKAVDLVTATQLEPRPPSGVVQRACKFRQKSETLIKWSAAAPERSIGLQASILQDLETALDDAVRATGSDMGNVQLVRPEGLRIVAHRGFKQPFLDFYAVVDDASAASCGMAKKMRRRIVVADVAADPIFAGTPAEEIMAQAHVRWCQSTPLVGEAGVLLGMLNAHCATVRSLAPREEQALDRIARRTASWLEGLTT